MEEATCTVCGLEPSWQPACATPYSRCYISAQLQQTKQQQQKTASTFLSTIGQHPPGRRAGEEQAGQAARICEALRVEAIHSGNMPSAEGVIT